jgi:hypothetical protein
MRKRIAIFLLLVAACFIGGGGYVAWVALGARSASADAASRQHATVGGRTAVVFRNLSLDHDTGRYGAIALARLSEAKAPRVLTSLRCLRVYFAGGRGLCLASGGGFGVTVTAKIFGPDFRIRRKLPLAGLPSRARVSPDGHLGAVTTFVGGDSYSAMGGFSTRTTLIDMERGRVLANLEQFEVTRGGSRIHAPDFNFWGVTFARDSNRFYATLATGGKTYLIEGDARSRKARVLHENVECPSLSPDNRRIAYKKRVGRGEWRLHVLDLATMRETSLGGYSIDDQVEWLDNDRILYGFEAEIWVMPVDGTGSPREYLLEADSPAVVRGPWMSGERPRAAA